MQRTLFDAEPQLKLARNADKATSHAAAAETIPKLPYLQQCCMIVIGRQPSPMTANEIGEAASNMFNGMQESYRKRVHELVRAGLLREAGERVCRVTGKGATVYERVR